MYILRRFVFLRDKNSIVQISNRDGRGWLLTNSSGQIWSARLVSDVFISQHLIVLNFRRQGKHRTDVVLISSDAVDPKEFRRLRVFLFALPAVQAEFQEA